MSPPVRVLFVLLPGTLALDWAGPAEALRIANQVLGAQGRAAGFELEFVGPLAEPVSSVGLGLRGVAPLPDSLDASRTTWIVLPGQTGAVADVTPDATRAALRWLRRLRVRRGAVELVCICAGSVLAAHAGLLDGIEATTHHQHLEELRRVAPRCQVLANRVFVASGAVWSSAGVTTGIDLMLHRIADASGALVAARVAEAMVVALRRGPADPELSPFLAHRGHLHLALHRLQDAICREPQRAWSVDDMARLACLSPRHLSRLFGEHAGITPLQYLQRIRLSTAEAALRAGARVGQAAALAGFSSDVQLRRAWGRLGGGGRPSSLRAPPAGLPVGDPIDELCPGSTSGAFDAVAWTTSAATPRR